MLVFRRTGHGEDLLIVASLNNNLPSGYWIYSENLPDANWREIFNSDAAAYGGAILEIKVESSKREEVMPDRSFLPMGLWSSERSEDRILGEK